jgi:hypothetical protein
MIIALIHWRIQPDETSKSAFLDHWKTNNTIGDRTGLMAEFLSDSLPVKEFPDITWHLDSESLGNFKSYVTVGIWDDTEAFHKQVADYFNDDNPLLPFEKYRRRRVIFRPIEWRIGKRSLPPNDSPGVK